MAGRAARLPGNLLGGLAFRRSAGATLPGLGMCAGGVLASTGHSAWYKSPGTQKAFTVSSTRAGARSGTVLERPARNTVVTVLRRVNRSSPQPTVRGTQTGGRGSRKTIIDGNNDGKLRCFPRFRVAGTAAGSSDRAAPSIAPRKPREPASRLSHKGQGSLIVLLLILVGSSAILSESAAGP